MNRGPDFIGIGVQKGGTSWLAACLDSHPQIVVPIKEIGFFSKWYSEKGVKRYEEKLAQGVGTRTGVLVGEFSTSYFHSRNVAGRIRSCYPDCKVILSLRNPVDRLESIVRHRKMRGRNWDIEDGVEKSKYGERLEEWLTEFPGMKVIFYENLKNEPYLVLRELWEYLGVDDHVPEILYTRVNRSVTPRLEILVRVFDWLGSFRYSWWAKSWWWSTWATKMRDVVKGWNDSGRVFRFNYFERRQLWSLFQEDVDRVRELVGSVPWGWYG